MNEQKLHVIFGTGPVGCWVARSLREMDIPVRAVNRSGNHPALMPAEVELVKADVSDPQQAIQAAQGAAVIYQALNPPYHQWHAFFPGLQASALAAAKATGARYVSIENLYMYESSKTMTEDSPEKPKSKKGELRKQMGAEVLAAHQRGEIQAVALRSSDYYGPGVEGSAMGEMVFGNLAAGKKAQIGGSDKMPHSWAYIEDVGKAAVDEHVRQHLPEESALQDQLWDECQVDLRSGGDPVEQEDGHVDHDESERYIVVAVGQGPAQGIAVAHS